MNINKIGFIGLGLIGGSIAKTIKSKYSDIEMIALASREETIKKAYNDGLISNPSFLSLEEYAACDILFFCSPVGINVKYLKELKPILSKDCLLTDVGSVKGDIHNVIDELGLSAQFIGGHPMAGSEAIGYDNSTDHLLENAYYILTYSDEINKETVLEFDDFISSLGSLTLTMTPKEHDFATAAISHLPHIISASLVNIVKENDSDDAILKTIAAGGFKDITRISSSSPVMWEHICMTNQKEILRLMSIYENKLNEFKSAIASLDSEKINSLFSSAKDYRDSLPIRNTGMLQSTFEFYLDLKDEAGGIATVARILADADLSIKNIGIIHNREFEKGALHIEMYNDEDMVKAKELLNKQSYIIFDK